VTVGTRRYSIELPGGYSSSPQLASQDCFFDGKDVFLFDRFRDDTKATESISLRGGKLVREATPRPVSAMNKANLTVREGPVPYGANNALVTLWLAFSSHHSFPGKMGSLQGAPLFNEGAPYHFHRLKLTQSWKKSPAPPSFVTEAEGLHPGEVYALEGNRLVTMGLRGELARGYRNWSYRVLEWTNAGAWAIPSHSILTRMRVAPEAPEALQTNGTCELWVTNVALGVAAVPAAPRSQPATVIRDERSRVTKVDGQFTYFSDTGKILNSEDLMRRNDYKHTVSSLAGGGARSNSVGRWSRLLFYIIVASVVAGPLVFALWKSASRYRQSKSNTKPSI